MLNFVDGDVFGRVAKLGRAAARAVWLALDGGTWDAFLPSKCLDELFCATRGLPSLPVVVAEPTGLQDAPLLSRVGMEPAIERIRRATVGQDGSVLDLILGSVTERSILRGDYGTRGVLDRFFEELLGRAVLTGRGGFLEQHGSARLDQARTLLAPVAAAAAAVLNGRHGAKRLQLARPHANIGPDSDLLGGC
jgi:hypothetical protein